ncbi:MAG TPA: UvrB/UvrC motif-containing protein [Bacteroidia bacterium]|jgi:hypothetical protein|nr:UvrB/UvrC motif-containing protein [Bacteroidia bacterium]
MKNKFLKLWSALFGSKKNKPKRRYVKDVKTGDYIQIEWHRMKNGIGYIKCLNNDPETKKIFLEVRWGNYKEAGIEERQKLILDYKSIELMNFHLLNQVVNKPESTEDDSDIATLQKKMNEALDKEEYEKADELQKKINNLLKK